MFDFRGFFSSFGVCVGDEGGWGGFAGGGGGGVTPLEINVRFALCNTILPLFIQSSNNERRKTVHVWIYACHVLQIHSAHML